MSTASLAVGRAVAGEQDVVLMPHMASKVAGRRGIILCHPAGYGASVASGSNAKVTSFPALVSTVVDAGFAAVCTDLGGGFTWGNDTLVTRMGQARTLLNALGCATDKVLIIGMSMGNLSALRYAADNPTQVAAVAAVVPACDVEDIRINNRGGLAQSISDAWGIAAGAAVPTRGVTLQRATDLFGLPWRGYYSNADTVATAAGVTALVAAIGSTASKVQVSTTADHPGQGASPDDRDSVGKVDTADLIAFLRAHAG